MGECRYLLPTTVDLASVDEVRSELRALLRSQESDVVVDCTRTDFIDSTGVAVLLEANQELVDSGRRLVLDHVNSGPRRVLEILGLTDLVRDDARVARMPRA